MIRRPSRHALDLSAFNVYRLDSIHYPIFLLKVLSFADSFTLHFDPVLAQLNDFPVLKLEHDILHLLREVFSMFSPSEHLSELFFTKVVLDRNLSWFLL